MAISIVPAKPQDMDEMIPVGQAAFADNKLFQAQYMLDTATPQQLEEFASWRKELGKARMFSPHSHYFKALDESNGKIVGYIGLYDPYEEVPDKRALPVTPYTRIDTEVEEELKTKMKTTKEKWIKGREDVWYVQSMVVHPDYQGRGIATKLLRRGLEQADKSGQDVYLEGTAAGLSLYRRCGFEDLEKITLDSVDYELVAMIWHPAANSTQSTG